METKSFERIKSMSRSKRYPQEFKERSVALVLEHQGEHRSQWACIESIAAKSGMTPESLRRWVRQAEVDGGKRTGLSTDERQRLKELERENKELRRTNEILKAASAFFARELDPGPPKK